MGHLFRDCYLSFPFSPLLILFWILGCSSTCSLAPNLVLDLVLVGKIHVLRFV